MPSTVLLVAVLLAAAKALPGELPAYLPGEKELAPLERQGEVERYTPDTLWEKIDGEAELYRRFHLKEAATAFYAHPADESRRVEIFLFAVQSPFDAFGLLASFRSPTDVPADLGNGGLKKDYQTFFWQGNLFVLVDGTGNDDVRPGDLAAAAKTLTGRLGPPGPPPPVLGEFGKVAAPAGIAYIPDHLLGREALPPGLEGKLADGTGVFLSLTQVDAAKVVREFGAALSDAGPVPWSDLKGVIGTDPALGPVTVVTRGGRLAGARSAPSVPGVESALRRLLNLQP